MKCQLDTLKAVKRNISRFPEEFCFQLTTEELESLRSQIATLNESDGRGKHRKYLLEQIFEYISEHTESSQKIFFDGQIYDAFSLIVSLIKKANKEITLIDGYVDVGTLNLLSKKKSDVIVTIYTQKRTKMTKADIENFNAQYLTLGIKFTKIFHDRFLILDRTIAYHVGASLKDAGKKCFGINLIQDGGIIKDILQRLELETEE